ncbi:MAG: twin-arginine translocase TatA/TatE family subunit [Myxococcota bacterium]
MFGLSFWEIGVILIIALVILGPKKLPELAKSLGKGIREFRNATDDFKSTMDEELAKPDPKKELPKPRPAAGPTAAADEVEAEVVPASAAETTEKVKEDAKPAAPAPATTETT